MPALLNFVVRSNQPSRETRVVTYLDTQFEPTCPCCKADVFVNSETPTEPWFNSCVNGHSHWFKMIEIDEEFLATGT